MKTTLFFLSTIALLCVSCTKPMTYDEHLARVRAKAPQKALESEDRWVLKYGDFTGDGNSEMVAFVYEVTDRDEEMEWGRYYLCYSTQNALTVCDTLYGSFYTVPEMIETKNGTLLFYTIGAEGPTGESFGWRCTEKGLSPVAIPGELHRIDENCFVRSASGFNSFVADGEDEYEAFSPGRCFYAYYYFFDGERFREYGGKSLTEQQFRDTYGGADILRQIRNKGLTIDDIYYRANGIININCSWRTMSESWSDEAPKPGKGLMYMEMKVTGRGLETEEGLQPGKIKASITPDCVAYPD